MNLRYFACILMVVVLGPDSLATTIHVPQDQPTIQAGIDAANNEDVVLVAPGTYFELINFNGKNVVVKSQGGPSVTFIDASHTTGPVVRFTSGEGPKAALAGFTIQNGSLCCFPYEGGGVEISNSSPSIVGNNIRNNVGAGNGGGVNIHFGAPLIKGNTIAGNSVAFFGGTEGGGIDVLGSSSPYAQIIGNVIHGNYGVGLGGGIGLNGGAGTVIQNNKIYDNNAESQGGAIWMANQSDEVIVQNLIARNSAPSGAEIYSLIPFSDPGFILVNNTIASKSATADAAVIADGFNTNAQIANNIIATLGSEAALLCNPIYHDGPPAVSFNDVYSQRGTSYGDSCAGFAGADGNISLNPRFVNPFGGKLQLQQDSLAINAGDNSAFNLPATDLAGNPRIVGGVVDMGAYEYQGTAKE